MKVFWYVADTHGVVGQGQFEPTSEQPFEEIEKEFIETISKFPNTLQAGMRIRRDDDSGWYGLYEKRGAVWCRVQGDNIVPFWFPWVMIGLFLVGFFFLWLVTR